MRNEDFFMDNGVVTDNVIDTSISHNMGSKLLDNGTFTNNHITWNNSTKKVPFSNKYLYATSYINDMQPQPPTSNDTIKVEHTLVKDSSQVPQNKTLKTFHQNIRGLGNKFNLLMPNDDYSSHTATLTSKCCILYIYSTNTGTEYFKHRIYSPFFPLQNAVCFINLTYLVPVLFTFYIESVLKLKK